MKVSLAESAPRRFLFSVAGGYGHLHPLMPLAHALKQAGHEVAFAVGASMSPSVEASGFTVFPLGKLSADPEYQRFQSERQDMPLGLTTELSIYSGLWLGITPRVRTPDLVAIARQWQPDMLIRETGEYAAAIAAEHLGLPHATISVLASLKGQAIFEREAPGRLDPVRLAWSLPPDPDLSALYRYLCLAYAPPSLSMHDLGDAWSLDMASPIRSIPTTTHFIRPQIFDNTTNESLPGWTQELRSTGRPTVYATMGTEVNKEPGIYPFVLRTIIEGLSDLPLNLLVTLGRDRDPADFGPQPPNVHIEPYVPQSLLLPLCDLMVMHGGSNSLLAAIDAVLPVVVIPFIADQFYNAEVTQRMGLGQVVQTWQPGQPGEVDLRQLTPATVRAAVEEVLGNPAYRENVRLLQTEMHSLPADDYAVQLVETVAATRQPVGRI